MLTCPLGHKEQISQLHEFHTTFLSRDTDQNKKRSLTFCTGVKFQVGSNFKLNQFQQKWAQINQIVM